MSSPPNVPPTQFQLDLYSCPDPKDPFWISTIQSLNQFAQQTAASITQLQQRQPSPPQYKTLTFATKTNPLDSFPINFPWPQAPNDLHIAKVDGPQTPTLPITPQWSFVSNGGRNNIQVTAITGLSANSQYTISLSLS